MNLLENSSLPQFLIVGAAKSGTTSIYSFLRKHPSVWMPTHKEPNFFSGITESGSVNSLDDYKALFDGAKNKITGEASVSYLPFYRTSIPRIKKLLGDPKIVMILREPCARAFSHYTYFCQLGLEKKAFEETLSDNYRVSNDPWGGTMNPYVEPGRYYSQAEAFKRSFSNVRIYLYEDLLDSANLIADLYSFLEVEHLGESSIEVRNVSGKPKFPWVRHVLANRFIMHNVVRYVPSYIKDPLRNILLDKPRMPQVALEKLRHIYKQDVLMLEDLLGRDLSAWGYR